MWTVQSAVNAKQIIHMYMVNMNYVKRLGVSISLVMCI